METFCVLMEQETLDIVNFYAYVLPAVDEQSFVDFNLSPIFETNESEVNKALPPQEVMERRRQSLVPLRQFLQAGQDIHTFGKNVEMTSFRKL